MTDMNAADAATPSEASSQSIESNPDIVAAFDRFAQSSGEAKATTAEQTSDDAGTESQQQQDSVPAAAKPQPGQEAAKAEPKADPLATLDPALRHAARRAGWTESDLRDFVTSAPPNIVDGTLNRLYQSYNDISTRFAQFGQQRPAAQQQPGIPQRQAAQQPQSPFEAINAAFSDEAVNQLRDEYGDGIVEKLIEPLRTIVQPLKEMSEFVQQQRNETIAREVDVTMKSLAAEFGEIYGTPEKQPTQPQMALRQQLFGLADQILVGAQAQGLPISIGEAIERANLILAAPTTQQRERQKIASKVKERSRQITARPTQRNTPLSPVGGQSDQAAEQAVAARMAELGLTR